MANGWARWARLVWAAPCSLVGLLAGPRDAMDRWVQAKGLDNLPLHRREKNSRSIDALPTADFDE